MNKLLIIGFFFIFVFLGCNREKPTSTLTWTSINVNAYLQQGDAHLIREDNTTILIDTGHKTYTQKIVIPTLQKQHITHINKIIITHPHNDHYGGIIPLIKAGIKIGQIYMNMPSKSQMEQEPWGGKYEELEVIRSLAKARHIPLLPIKMGDRYKISQDAYIEVLYVYNGIDTPVGKTDLNDMSAICMLHHGKNKFLFTGDLNKRLGRYLAEHSTTIEADILKAPHHGTEGFPPNSFFEKVKPKVLIVPAPKHIWWSKRSKRLRDLARVKGYKVYVNGFNGNIVVTSDGKDYQITTDRNLTGLLSK